ncbi:putative membrane protein SirB2 [Evansella vedderi]|uniref:Membrane protein SirB2 n=1 Tax=Evansella vedderi TaxID=38282 RepID=A0ABU0A0M2_9BACI|nr:putative membrane protein SirB2 [Evansella vedderi]
MLQYYSGILHTHALLWLLAIVLFFLIVIFLNKGKGKIAKILQMVLRLFYVLLLVTGVILIYINDFELRTGFHWESYVKGALAFWLIYVMEMISTRMSKGTLDNRGKLTYWVQFVVAFILVLFFGYVMT